MDILSLDILQFLKLLVSPWRWRRREQPSREKEILRYNITGLQIVVINSEGRIVSHSFESSTNQFASEIHGIVESLLINIELERSVIAEFEKGGQR